jgi:hypothetical protein
VRRVLLVFSLVFAALPYPAQAQQPVEYRGMSISTIVRNDNDRTSTVFVRLFNPNQKPVEARNIRCEFHKGDQLVKRLSISRVTVQPGEGEYEAPEKVEAQFNRPVCKLGKQAL